MISNLLLRIAYKVFKGVQKSKAIPTLESLKSDLLIHIFRTVNPKLQSSFTLVKPLFGHTETKRHCVDKATYLTFICCAN